jgi:hypothetical protein
MPQWTAVWHLLRREKHAWDILQPELKFCQQPLAASSCDLLSQTFSEWKVPSRNCAHHTEPPIEDLSNVRARDRHPSSRIVTDTARTTTDDKERKLDPALHPTPQIDSTFASSQQKSRRFSVTSSRATSSHLRSLTEALALYYCRSVGSFLVVSYDSNLWLGESRMSSHGINPVPQRSYFL